MASFSTPLGSFSPQEGIDLSEETRLAQMQRIEELRSRIDAKSWTSQKQNIKLGTELDMREDFAGSTRPNPSNSEAYFDSLPKRTIDFQIGQISSADAHQLSLLTTSEDGFWNTFGEAPPNGTNGIHTDQEHAPSSSSAIGAVMGSIFSKSSERSSNSSVETPDRPIKIEDDTENINISAINQLKAIPEISSGLYNVGSDVPTSIDPTVQHTGHKRRRLFKETKLKVSEFKPRTSIPVKVPQSELARQSIEAALSSRLNPFVLHPDECKLLRDHICHLHITTYLNIRNRILRLWVRNPLVTVTPEEAAGCAYGSRWLGLAEVAYEWLVRRGYINFGCVEVPDPLSTRPKKPRTPGNTIVVVGAGMSGLGCARQLEGLFRHYRDKWTIVGEEPPNVIVIEGRSRIGGRIYSHPLNNQAPKRIPRNLRCTAELGAHIITGFDRGNPLNMIIRGQLALHYYPLKDNSTLYDIDGKVVNRERDSLVEKLFNDILDRASLFRHKQKIPTTVEGDRKLVEAGKDPTGPLGKPISRVELEMDERAGMPEKTNGTNSDHVAAGVNKLTGKAHLVAVSREKAPAAIAAEAMGWTLATPAYAGRDLDLYTYAQSCSYPTLGGAMDEGVKQYQKILNLSTQDLRLLNWHFANLEYANAASVGKLSLGGWDQDIGNEFEGEHAQVIGGYIQVPRGILHAPKPLDLRTKHVAKTIQYSSNASTHKKAKIFCANGEVFEASHVVLTIPLGVLKSQSILFEPKLPDWKADSIARLGFGTLNKVILLYDKPFWDVEQDMIGLLQDAEEPGSYEQTDYALNRGRFYLFWNCIKTSGRPLLIALLAGDAAHQAETSLSDAQLIAEVTQQLAKMFRHKPVPPPLETIVTRWGKDEFARGTYSFVSPAAHSDDYDSMARPVGNLHFAGEATCGTHPATVHGAYISGLRAASDVIEQILGPIEVPQPLVPALVKDEPGTSKPVQNPGAGSVADPARDESYENGEIPEEKQVRLQALENVILKSIFDKIGMRPLKPDKAGANPFLLYSKDKWAGCKAICDEARRTATGNLKAKASRNEIRTALGQMWRDATEEVKKPYIDRTVSNRASNAENAKGFQDQLATWDSKAINIRMRYIEEHPGCMSEQEERDMWHALGVVGVVGRRAKKDSGYAE